MKKKLKTSWELIWRDKFLRLALLIIFLLLSASFLILLLSWSKLPSEIPLFYSLPWGKDQLSDPINLWFFLLGTAFLNFLNVALVLFSFKKYPFISKVLLWTTVSLTVFTSFALLKIIFLIT